MKKYTIAVVGATGVVGETMIRVLAERKFPVGELRPLASEDSRGKTVRFNGRDVPVQVLSKRSFEGVDFALFSAGGSVSLEYAPIAAKAGAIVIDNTSAFRMDKDVPLIVPEVNGNVLTTLGIAPFRVHNKAHPEGCYSKNGKGFIIANPNCSTIQLVCVLKPIHDVAKIKRVVVATYQSVSGAGKDGTLELSSQTASVVAELFSPPSEDALLNSGKASFATTKDAHKVFPHQIAFNCIPHIDVFEENGYTKEEMKVVRETKKIMRDDSIEVTCTAVRVPVMVGHSEAVNIETERKISADDVRKILSKSPGVVVVDDPSQNKYPLAINAEGHDETFVGRIREDVSCRNGIDLWVVADNVRVGAATNAVKIAEMLI